MSRRHHRAPWREKRAPKRKGRTSYYEHRVLRPVAVEAMVVDAKDEVLDSWDPEIEHYLSVLEHQDRLYPPD